MPVGFDFMMKRMRELASRSPRVRQALQDANARRTPKRRTPAETAQMYATQRDVQRMRGRAIKRGTYHPR